MCDIRDGLTIVLPLDYKNSPAVRPEVFDLMTDFPNLTKDVVNHSTLYYQMWTADPSFRESMTLQVRLLQNNTQPDLWNKIQDEIKSYPVACQTGPAYLFLALRRIHNCSESTLELVMEKTKKLKISDHEGEDIDDIARTLNIVVNLLHHSSSPDRNFITHDFCRDILRLLQTSSVSEFNLIFAEVERRCQVEADTKGESVVSWPTYDELIHLALATFHRLSANGQWVQAVPPAAYAASPLLGWEPGNCFNCGKKGCTPSSCTLPLNDATIATNKQCMEEWRKAHPRPPSGRGSGRGNGSGRGRGRSQGRGSHRGRGRGGSSGGKPHRKLAADGKPLKLNHLGNYVLDQTKWASMQKEASIDRLTALFTGGDAGAAPAAPAESASTASTLTTAASSAATATVASQDRAAQIREAVSRCFS